MKPSRKARHWIALPFALAATVTSVMAFGDFSGDPEPRWRRLAVRGGLVATLLVIAVNHVLDRRASASRGNEQAPGGNPGA